ncbi:urate oxidase [Alloacidobacterium dinghuense]|uniref:Uricase n=1 Tax=Alloacidobacterium dinghuense TaxID=2763107 RepID=A0A7G8BJZ9_9BACT|nr:urate oxidase [Alloacidobacterium dinghuense]QNI32869.1 urate oxidase [Alloacidobacterium dinghuense]
MIALGENQYGKSRVRVMKVERCADRHEVFEWNVDVWLKGDFTACFEDGDNSHVLPTDTMKNTIYSTARASKASTIEEFAIELATHFITTQPQVNEASANIKATLWRHIDAGRQRHPTAFVQTGPARETVTATYPRGEAVSVTSGFTDMAILKTANSAFAGYLRDRLTTLKETHDRLLGTLATAEWTYAAPGLDYAALRTSITDSLLNAFAQHESLSVQQTLFAMGKAALEAVPEITEIRLQMPNKHCNLVDLSAFDQDNPNHIFVPTDEPHGSIEACVRREV